MHFSSWRFILDYCIWHRSYTENGFCAENKRKVGEHFCFMFSEIYLVGSYLASVRPRFCEIVLAEDRTDQARSLHFPCLQVTAAIPEFHNVHSHSQVNTEWFQWGKQGWGRWEGEGHGNSGRGPDVCDDSSVIFFSSSQGICFYALKSNLRSRYNLGSN